MPYAQRLASFLNGSMKITSLAIAYADVETRCAYVRMVVQQHASLKLQRLLLQHQSILVPPKCTVRRGKIAHRSAYNKTCQITRQINTHTITSHICPDDSPAARVAETPASSLAAPEHLGAAQVFGTWWQDCPLIGLQQNVSNHTSHQHTHNHVTHMSG